MVECTHSQVTRLRSPKVGTDTLVRTLREVHCDNMKVFFCVAAVILLSEGIHGLLLPLDVSAVLQQPWSQADSSLLVTTVVATQPKRQAGKEYGRLKSSPSSFSHIFTRARRLPIPTHRIIDPVEDCFLVTSEEGQLFFKSPSDEPSVCGIYMIADPDKRIQVTFNYIDVPCENGGLVAWVDGWELNGQVWPADAWDDDRVVESCDRRPQRKLVSQQNAALIQYRVPAQGKGFAVTVRHVKNPRPCNVMLFGSEGVYTLRNHGETGNCSVIAVSPAIVRVLDLNVGQAMKRDILDLETGTIHRCIKRGIPDYAEIGGASGLDHTKMEVLDSVCGLDSNEGRRPAYIACEDTVVRLVSSGRYHNSITLAFAPLPMEDIEHSDLICGLDSL